MLHGSCRQVSTTSHTHTVFSLIAGAGGGSAAAKDEQQRTAAATLFGGSLAVRIFGRKLTFADAFKISKIQHWWRRTRYVRRLTAQLKREKVAAVKRAFAWEKSMRGLLERLKAQLWYLHDQADKNDDAIARIKIREIGAAVRIQTWYRVHFSKNVVLRILRSRQTLRKLMRRKYSGKAARQIMGTIRLRKRQEADQVLVERIQLWRAHAEYEAAQLTRLCELEAHERRLMQRIGVEEQAFEAQFVEWEKAAKRAIAAKPLPKNWMLQAGKASTHTYYINTVSGEIQSENPLQTALRKWGAHQRKLQREVFEVKQATLLQALSTTRKDIAQLKRDMDEHVNPTRKDAPAAEAGGFTMTSVAAFALQKRKSSSSKLVTSLA
jgi:hypothetical protein